MGAFRKPIMAQVALLIFALAVFVLRSCDVTPDGGASQEPSPTASTQPPLRLAKISTKRIEDSIEKRLTKVSGEKTKVKCPDQVKERIGTKFTCDVSFADQPGTKPVATAKVRISGPNGEFKWTSEPN